MSEIKMITANSREGGEVYRLLNLVHAMAGRAANSNRKDWQLSRTQSDPMYGPIVTVWTNGIVDIEAKTWMDQEPPFHVYTLSAMQKDEE